MRIYQKMALIVLFAYFGASETSPGPKALLALLWQFSFDTIDNEFFTVGASPGWRPCEDVDDGLPDCRHARLWRRSPDSFFSVPLL